MQRIQLFSFVLFSFLTLSSCKENIQPDIIYAQNVVVGAGLSGIVIAERLANVSQEDVLIIERREHIGGNVYDYKNKNNITVQKYGIHAFHTNNKEVWDYLSHFTQWNNYKHHALAETSKGLVNFPVNLNTLDNILGTKETQKFVNKITAKFGKIQKISINDLQQTNDQDLQKDVDILFNELFKNYTIKQWGLSAGKIDPTIIARVPIYLSRKDLYFTDTYQGIPKEGYTKMLQNMLNNPHITIMLNTDWKNVRNKIHYKKLFYSGSIDEFFDYKYGKLPYRSLKFDIKTFPQVHYQKTAQVNHPNHPTMTRSIEHKYLLQEKSSVTTVSFEYPEAFNGSNERYYPINNEANNNLYNKYLTEAKKFPNVYFFGRLGDYKYYNMDQAIERALSLYTKSLQ